MFTGTVCVTVTSQAPLWFRIRPQELGDKDKTDAAEGGGWVWGAWAWRAGWGCLYGAGAGSLGDLDQINTGFSFKWTW